MIIFRIGVSNFLLLYLYVEKGRKMINNYKEKTQNNMEQTDNIFQRIFTFKSTFIALLISISLFLIALWTKSDLFIFLFIASTVFIVLSFSHILPDFLFDWFKGKKEKNYYTWSRYRANKSVTDFTKYFFDVSDTFREEDIQNNFDRDKQIVKHLQSFTKEELEIGLALLSNSKIENPIFSFLTTSAILTIFYQQRHVISELIKNIFSLTELPSFLSVGLFIEFIIFIGVIIGLTTIEWNHRSYLIKVSEIALKNKR